MPSRPSTPAEALAFLQSLAPSGVRLGLDRIHAALRALRNPERDFPALHVAGTNGKGSTSAFAASCLTAQGYKVGLYTSPHLERVNERIQIDGVEISDEVFGRRILEVLELYPEALADPAPLTYFEFGTLVALWHFSRERVDVAVLETGLGGRLDATTAAAPAVCAITPVSFDHMDYLGHTLAAIAAEKAGIIKPGVPVVVARQPPEVLAVIEAVAREKGALVAVQDRDFRLEPEPSGTLVYRGTRTSVGQLSLGLKGPHQVQNAAVALACLEHLEVRGLPISQKSVREGLVRAKWPGRLETFEGEPKVVLDGAHNPAGAEALARALDVLYPGQRIHAVFGVLSDKDYRPVLRTLLPRFASVHLTPVPNPRTLAPGRYADEARALCPEVELYASPKAAFTGAVMRAGPGEMVLGTGSLFLVGALRPLAQGRQATRGTARADLD
ncbi:MAG: bifunctional folylpolyglutamate synthase/dihydrofolate synthase [Myxococcaceae bacterium]|nr:bifunctional folylpolyglutamate synthase/dihydrofolate synthase [Myxococcaceae bacterium]